MQLARLGNQVAFAANVGTDLYGDFCITALQQEGVDVSLVHRRADLKTGITVSVTSTTDRALITYPGAMSSLRADDFPNHVFAGFRHFHVSSYFLQDGLRPGLKGLFREARRQGVSTSLDPGHDPTGKWSTELIDTLEEVDVFLPNETELQQITRCTDVVDGLRKLHNGHTLVVAKLGAKGCISLSGGKPLKVDALAIEVVDTTGAGDSFNAGFLHAWLSGWFLQRCLSFAVACGALSTRGLGGTTAQATEEEVEEYIRAQAGR